MKKLLTSLILATVAFTVNAASIDWNLSGMNKILSEKNDSAAGGTTVYLILADNTSLASITYDETNNPLTESQFQSALAAITIGTVTAGSDGKKPSTTLNTVSSGKLTAGDSYDLAALYVSKSGDDGFYRISAAPGTAYDPSVEGSSGSVSTSWATLAGASWVQGFGVRQQDPVIPDDPSGVPEPATGALALAGVALLFKRRRA